MAKNFKSVASKLIELLSNKGYDLATIVYNRELNTEGWWYN
jgi:hypothetical protein